MYRRGREWESLVKAPRIFKKEAGLPFIIGAIHGSLMQAEIHARKSAPKKPCQDCKKKTMANSIKGIRPYQA
jgi:hypothetical protein